MFVITDASERYFLQQKLQKTKGLFGLDKISVVPFIKLIHHAKAAEAQASLECVLHSQQLILYLIAPTYLPPKALH